MQRQVLYGPQTHAGIQPTDGKHSAAHDRYHAKVAPGTTLFPDCREETVSRLSGPLVFAIAEWISLIHRMHGHVTTSSFELVRRV